jgi:hypothetical protein
MSKLEMDSFRTRVASPKTNRRHLIVAVVSVAGLFLTPVQLMAQEKQQVPNLDTTGTFRVRTVLELSGEIRLKNQQTDGAGKNGKSMAAKTAPIKASSTVDYDEQFQSAKGIEGCRTYQNFHEANSQIQVDRHITKTTLREQCRDIIRFGTPDQGLITTCLDNPLFAAERDLIEGPISSMFLDQLLTDRDVQLADKWIVDRDVACRLLNVDAIQDGKLTMCLVDADESKAQLELEGNIIASVRQVPTEIHIEGKVQLDRSSGTVSWFAANIEETRDISESEPGFQVTAQVKILRSKLDGMTNARALGEVLSKMGNRDAASLLQFQSDTGFYRFLASRKWSTYRDNGEEATLRYVVNNRVVAQCNVTNMVDFEPGRQLSLEGFKADVARAIGNNLVEIVEGSERLTSNNLRLLRVVSQGNVQGVGIDWIHYHLSNDSGRRVVLAFTLNEANSELFAQEDAQIAGSFELVNWPTKLDSKALDAASNKPSTDQATPIAAEAGQKKVLISQPSKLSGEAVPTAGRPKLPR